VGERRRRERFLQHSMAALEQPPAQNLVVRIAGHEKHFGLWTGRDQALRDESASHLGHHDVAQEQVDHTAIVRRESQGVLPVDRLQHGVALCLEHAVGQPANAVLVLDQQDRLAMRRTRATLGARLRCRLYFTRDGQIDAEGRSAARHAVDGDHTIGLLHDAVDCRETEAGAAPRLLRGEKRLEGARHGLRGHPHPRVADAQQHCGTRV
jgi:hypothetical protein